MSGWVLYDGECTMCVGAARRLERAFRARGYEFAPLQSDWARRRLALPEAELLTEMKVITPGDAVLGGAEAVVHLADRVWWGKPLAWAARIPGMRVVLAALYRFIAKNRGCHAGACRRPRASALDSFPLIALPLIAAGFKNSLPPWLFMWTLSVAVFFGFKWRMLTKARGEGAPMSAARSLGFLFAWPGMDAKEFAADAPAPVSGWAVAIAKTAFGAAMFWLVARHLSRPLAAGWCGMIGIVFLLHFGSFHLLSLAWRKAGVDARPLMNAPVLATSLGDFWGNRWNQAFRQLGYELVFVPYRRALGTAGATFAIFVLSGLIHDAVISYPAGGGWGLPTLYFLIQGAGVLFEKSRAGRALGLGRGLPGRVFAAVVTAGPAVILFHPPFVERVILPFMKFAGAL